MAQTKLIIAFLFLAILLSQTEGRNLNFKDKSDELQTHAKISGQDSTKFTGQSKSLPHDYCSGLSACGKEAAFTPPTNVAVAAAEPQAPPPAGHADDFRPTTPGHSPGIGHS